MNYDKTRAAAHDSAMATEARRQELQALLGNIIECLEADEKLPDAVELKPTTEDENPFF